MKRKAFSLIEVLIALVLIGMITISFFPILVSETKAINSAFRFTEDGFEIQTLIEKEMNFIREKPDTEWASHGFKPLNIKLYSTKPVEVQAIMVKSKDKDIGTDKPYNRDVLVLVPSKGTADDLPVAQPVLTGSNPSFDASVNYKKGDVDKKKLEFCVYRWYIGDYVKATGFDVSNLVMIREHNISKNSGDPRPFIKKEQLKFNLRNSFVPEELSYDGKEYKLIGVGPHAYLVGNAPLVNKALHEDGLTGEGFKLGSLNYDDKDAANNLTPEELNALYDGKGLVMSAMPVTKTGDVGKEVFTKMMDLKIKKTEMKLAYFIESITPEGKVRVKLLLRQTANVDPGHIYSMRFRMGSTGDFYYPRYHALPIKGYYSTESSSHSPKLKVDSSGNSQFDFLLPRGEYQIRIIDGANDIIEADLSI